MAFIYLHLFKHELFTLMNWINVMVEKKGHGIVREAVEK